MTQSLVAGAILSDNFSASTLNSTAPAAPTSGSAAYHLLSSKTWNPTPTIAVNDLKFGIGTTTSGHIEAQALFSTTPIALTNAGDFLELSVTFVNTSGLFAQSGHVGFGLYSSGGMAPIAGGMNSTAVVGTTGVTGGAQGWRGYVARVAYSGGTHRIATRPAQTSTTGNNQDLITEGSNSQSYTGAVNLASSASTFTQATGSQLTETLRFTLAAPANLQIDSKLYLGADTNGTLLVNQSASASGANFLTNSFDALCVGWRATDNTLPTLIDIQSIRVTTSLSTGTNVTGWPVATAFAPANNGIGLCLDTLLRITFDKPVLLQKSGAIRIYDAAVPAIPVDTIDLGANVDNPPADGSTYNTAINVQPRAIGGETFTNHPVCVSGSTATIFPHTGVLTTNETYYVLMDSGVFTDTNGNVFPGISATNAWQFTTKATGPANGTNLVVAADGSGDFCTVQGAVDYVPSGNTTARLINIRNGIYSEIVNVINRHNLTFRGQNRSNTIIAYDNNSAMNGSTHYRMVFKVNANDIALDSLTITNSTPKGGSQGEALMVESDKKRFVAYNVNLCSFQDTILLNTSGTQCYFQDSLIQGDTDFIWGGGNAFFTNCELKSLFGGYLTQPRTAASSNGMSFVSCHLTKNGAITATLGRALGYTDGNVAFIGCLIDSHITGWTDVNPRYWEFGNSNLAATAAVTYNGAQLSSASSDLTNARSAVLWLNGWAPTVLPNIPQASAFPGAEGAGASATGGRGGDVYYVTTLADSGAGSLRAGISGAPTSGRTICFKVSGNIALSSTLTINKPNITVAGQTAPGDGICLQNNSFNISANNVIVRHMRTRLGTNNLAEADCMWIASGTNVIVDHVSASWSVDEVLSATGNTRDLTVQWCYITESLNDSIHSKGAHGYGSLITPSVDGTLSWHHNLYAHNNSRNPRPGTDSGATVILDFRNNAIYNYGNRAGYGSDWDPDPENLRLNYIANYIIAGPNSAYNYAYQGGGTNTFIYQATNLIDLDLDLNFDGINNNWSMFSGSYVSTNTPFTAAAVTTDPAPVALQRVLALGGAMPWRRDAADQRIVGTVRQHHGQIIDYTGQVGGWPILNSATAPADTDSDGMPDYWELAVGLNPNLASDGNITNTFTGYTRLEEYLNWLADPHALCERNGALDLSLRTATGGATNLSYTVTAGANGSVALLADGYTARFTAAANTSGVAGFAFTATDLAAATSFGPVNYGLLITTTNAPVSNTAPVLAPITNRTVIAGNVVNFTCSVTDTDAPPQTIIFGLQSAPVGATLGTNTGTFNWRPTIAQSDTTNTPSIIATDNGIPPLSATQTFTITVLRPAQPALQPLAATGGAFNLIVSGDSGPDYTVEASTNLVTWADLFTTNSPTLPFTWTDPSAASQDKRFYRVRLGP